MQLKILPAAKQDLDDIWSFIAQDSVSSADRVIDRITAMARLTMDQPQMGSPRSELGDGVRVMVVGAYLVFYRTAPSVIEVIRVLHGRRDLHADLF